MVITKLEDVTTQGFCKTLYSRWALIRGGALIGINTVFQICFTRVSCDMQISQTGYKLSRVALETRMQPDRLRNGMKCACASAHRAFSTPELTGLGLSLHAQKSSGSRLFNVWIKSYGVSKREILHSITVGMGNLAKRNLIFL